MLHITQEELKKALLGSGFIDEKQFNFALKEAESTDRDLANVLIEHGDISEEYLAEILADYFGVQFVALKKLKIAEEDTKMIPENVAKIKKIIIFGKEKDAVKLAMEDPGDIEAINFAEKQTGMKVIPYIATISDIREALGIYKKSIATDFAKIISENVKKSTTAGLDEVQMAQDLPVINILNTIIEYAIAERASDIHFEHLPKDFVIRFRVDGVLKDAISLPTNIHPAIVTRIKILSSLRIDEHRLPQDGRFRFEADKDAPATLSNTAMRVSIIPAFYGEKVVVRLLDEAERFLTLEELGFSKDDLKIIQQAIKEPHGMILSTGPTGSGKTTTLYTILHLLNRPEVNISTVEDPIEYDVKRVNQIQVNPKIGLTFAEGLRSLLRQDPDILMVGEIRDKETAEMAIHSALTGHLLLSTLHTNDAATAAPRLIDIGVEPFLLASTLNIIIAQRLVRKICTNCVSSLKQSEADKKRLDEEIKGIAKGETGLPTQLYTGKGCAACGGSGYKGRIGIFEILKVSSGIQNLIVSRSSADKIKAQALKEKMHTLLEDGFRKVESGLTTIEEVLRVTRE